MVIGQDRGVPAVGQVLHGGVARLGHLGHDPVRDPLLCEEGLDPRTQCIHSFLKRFRYGMGRAYRHRRPGRSGHHQVHREWRVGSQKFDL